MENQDIVARAFCPTCDRYTIVEPKAAEEILACGHVGETNPLTGLGYIDKDNEFRKITDRAAGELIAQLEKAYLTVSGIGKRDRCPK
jgi:hypothetical protein